jgi:Uncharacterized protein conserved in bacteria
MEAEKTVLVKAPWRIGEVIVRGDMPLMAGAWKWNDPFTFVPAYRVFQGMTSDGYYVIQDFYAGTDAKATNAYQLADLADTVAPFYAEDDVGIQYSIEGQLMSWYPDGQLESDVFFEGGKLKGVSYRYYDNGQLMLEVDHESGKAAYYGYDGQLIGQK